MLHHTILSGSSYQIETVTVLVFKRVSTAELGGPSTVMLAQFSTVLLAFTQQLNNHAEPFLTVLAQLFCVV